MPFGNNMGLLISMKTFKLNKIAFMHHITSKLLYAFQLNRKAVSSDFSMGMHHW